MSFLDTIGNIGEALSGIPYGLNQGMAPLNTWEGIRTKDLANDRSDILLQNMMLEQAAREGSAVPSFYGDWANAQQTGYQQTAAKNLYGVDVAQQMLARDQFARSPEFQARLQGLIPGSYDYNQALLGGSSQFMPMQIPEMYKQYGMNALDQQAAGQQYGENFLRHAILNQVDRNGGRLYPPGAEVFVRRIPGEGYIAMVDGVPVDIPASMLSQALAAEGIGGPRAATDSAIRLQQALQTGNANIISTVLKATEGYNNDPMVARLTQLHDAGVRELNTLVVNREKAAAAAFTDEARQQVAALDSQIASIRQRNNELLQMAVQRSSQRRGIGGMPGMGMGGGTPTPTMGAMSFNPTGNISTQVIAPNRMTANDTYGYVPSAPIQRPSRFGQMMSMPTVNRSPYYGR